MLPLAGTHAFRQGGLDEPPLGPLMPVQPTRVLELLRFEEAQPLVRTKEASSWLSAADLDWLTAPAALWCHQVEPAPTARVWLTLGGRPLPWWSGLPAPDASPPSALPPTANR